MNPFGIIFDMDDTLVATASLWRQAESHLLKLLGHSWSEEMARQYKGMNALDIAATIHRLLRPSVSREYCQKTMRDALFSAFEACPPEPMPGAIACVRRLSDFAPLVLASGSPLPLIESTLARLDLSPKFSYRVSSESVLRGKPSPDIFLAAADAVEIQPKNCLVIEDSLVGVQAARAAGMICFAIPSIHFEEIKKLADKTYLSLEHIAMPEVHAAFELHSLHQSEIP